MQFKIDKLGNWLFAGCFILLLMLPFGRAIKKEDKLISETEKRTLNTLPAIPSTLAEVAEYPKDVADYYSDHFGYREKLTDHYLNFSNWLGGSENNFHIVTQGKDGWLFFGGLKGDQTITENSMRDAMNLDKYSDAELVKFAEALSKVDDFLKAQGIHFVFMVAPSKPTIYFDKLPSYIQKADPESALDQLFAYLRAHTDVHVVDVRDELMAAKDQTPLYYKQDTHWNLMAANHAQYKLMTELARYVSIDITPRLLPIEQFEVIKSYSGGGDLWKIIRIAPVEEIIYGPEFDDNCNLQSGGSIEDRQEKRWFQRCEEKQGYALVYRDSFFEALRPYFSRQFRQTTYLWKRLNVTSLKKELKRQKPNVVVFEIVERSLPFVPDINFDGK